MELPFPLGFPIPCTSLALRADSRAGVFVESQRAPPLRQSSGEHRVFTAGYGAVRRPSCSFPALSILIMSSDDIFIFFFCPWRYCKIPLMSKMFLQKKSCKL